uniref:TYR_PHOSPHATASE_2 domain-containing protein n=1 Tax=Caenorhabditis tropicalis TaxID=1561998 RepID=A0A1I7U9S4_9PELO
MTQTPVLKNDINRTNDKFFFLAAQTSTQVIVSIVSEEEYEHGIPGEPDYNKYYPREVGDIVNLMRPKYSSTFTVKCTKKEEDTNCNAHDLHKAPASQTDTTNTFKYDEEEAQKDKMKQEQEQQRTVMSHCVNKTVMVHCADGVERSAMFVCAELARQRVDLELGKRSSSFDPAPWFQEVISSRAFFNGDKPTKEAARARNALFVVEYIFDHLKEMERKEINYVDGEEKKLKDFGANLDRGIGRAREEPTQKTED